VEDQRRLLARFDEQVRKDLTPPAPGWQVEVRGRIVRTIGPVGGHSGVLVGWQDFAGLTTAEVDELIREQVALFHSLGRHSEWKHYDHDLPADLSDRLVAAGLVREAPEALVVGSTARVLAACRAAGPASGVTVRPLTDSRELARVAALHGLVWQQHSAWLADELAAELTARPEDTVVFLAEHSTTRELVAAAWIRFTPGTDFAGLWGGSTHPGFRGRGAYRSLVRARAELADDRGVPYLQVDASPDSEPILRRLGLDRLGTTTPHTWRPG
jgi:ribosomal protein S18 acetylase RimI-like enzyme